MFLLNSRTFTGIFHCIHNIAPRDNGSLFRRFCVLNQPPTRLGASWRVGLLFAAAVCLPFAALAQAPLPVSTISCASASVIGEVSDACTVTLSGPAQAAGQNVELSTSSGAVWVPGNLIVPAGATSAGFTANVVSWVKTGESVTLGAATTGGSASFALQLQPVTRTLSVDASSVPFGDVQVGTPVTQQVTMSSTGNTPLTISGATVTGKGFTLPGVALPVTLSPGQETTWNVQFDPPYKGSITGSLTVSSTSSSGGTATTAIGLSGTGTSPQVELTWDPASSSGDPVVTYDVLRAPAGSSSFQVIGTSDKTQTTYEDVTAQKDQSYHYVVESVDASGFTSMPSNSVSVKVP